ncbi:N-6 DNA methylase [Acidiplasma sp.]|uniref:Eco57I restriction-modification methylase domain-containing protein n=1 Tax=Acidiplasma sp. TaxID=1872114 RepID=UPI0025887DDD|nr:N-6 DNA methylase [Acidiplasma sp.]
MDKIDHAEEDFGIDFERIIELISKYEQIKKSGEIKRYNEESTKKDFILPLFKALGWNVDNRGKTNDYVSAEETISKKRVDYGFRINGIPKFFLEAKSLKENNIQTNHKYIEQAIDYAWMKSCSWAVLTNFETLAVYNADWKDSNYGNNVLFVLHPNDFLNGERLNYLSKKAFENDELDNIASKYGKKQLKNPINKQLLQDMIHFREVLSKDIAKNNKRLNQDDIDESVQRILDRLIFIRNAEDRGLEANQLESNVRQWASKGRGQFVKEISKVYSYFDDSYNSKLFAHHLCDDIYIDNEPLQEVIEGLNHSKDNSYRYDFSIIESDVLGNIYEQYLGNILKSTTKGAKLEESKTHRKEQGIYYTPSYIVDYIVKNTVGEFIKTHTPEEIKNVRILDPACGSGSFLIRAYKELENYWIKELKLNEGDVKQTRFDINNSEKFYTLKTEILKNNIFGVDLDPKAVEIAQLNLLLQISERKQKLPILQNNIKVGNSLIDDPSISDKAFKWEDEFPEIMKEEGFDIIIGNPPYVFTRDVEFQDNFKKYIEYKYFENLESKANKRAKQPGKINLYALFIIKSITLLKNSGFFSFIIPNNILRTTIYDIIRKFILENCKIVRIVDLGSGVFENVTASTVILILQKENKINLRNNNKILVFHKFNQKANIKRVTQSKFLDNTSYVFNITLGNGELSLINKIEKNAKKLGDLAEYIIEGIVGNLKSDVVNFPINEKCRKFLTGKNINRYSILYTNKYIVYDRTKLHRARPEEVFTKNKIIIQRISGGNRPIKAVLDREGYFSFASTNLLTLKEDSEIELEYILGILNSKLMNWYYVNKFTNGSELTVNISKTFLEQIPIKYANKFEKAEIIELVNKMLSLKKKIVSLFNKKTDEIYSLETEFNKLDSRVDQLVYKIYELNVSEIKVVEEFFSK